MIHELRKNGLTEVHPLFLPQSQSERPASFRPLRFSNRKKSKWNLTPCSTLCYASFEIHLPDSSEISFEHYRLNKPGKTLAEVVIRLVERGEFFDS